MMTAFIAARALVFAAAFMGLWLWVIVRLQPWSGTLDSSLPGWLVAPGAAIVAAGAVGIFTCVALFVVRGRGTPAIFDPPRKFVAVGPYRYVRNPMYLSALAVFFGLGLYLRSLAIVGFAAAWFAIIHLFVVFVEEPGLEHRFGAAYDEYKKRVRRWLPQVAANIMRDELI
jgi:protein-S-isoprenylcysteine O-methyltransferase Ste14